MAARGLLVHFNGDVLAVVMDGYSWLDLLSTRLSMTIRCSLRMRERAVGL